MLLVNAMGVVQDVRIASIWSKRDRITTDRRVPGGGWAICGAEHAIIARKSASGDGEKFGQENEAFRSI